MTDAHRGACGAAAIARRSFLAFACAVVAVMEAIRESTGDGDWRFVHSGRLYSLSAEQRDDDRTGQALAQRRPAWDAGRRVRLTASILKLGMGERSDVKPWYVSEAENPLPVRFEFQPRSFLRFAFVWDRSLDELLAPSLLAKGEG